MSDDNDQRKGADRRQVKRPGDDRRQNAGKSEPRETESKKPKN
jgi:hypothetical protein